MTEPEKQASAFHTTRWSVVIAASKDGDDALAELCQRYWYPLYAFARRQGHVQENAKDLTQGFFEHRLEKGGLIRATPDKGRFRSFLLGAFKNYMSVVRRKENTAKRGGRSTIVSIDEELGESQYRIEATTDETPETLFYRSWARSWLQQVQVRLRETYDAAGRGELCQALEPYLTGSGETLSYQQKADEIGLTVSAVTSAVHRLRRTYRELLREAIAETVSDEVDIDEDVGEFVLKPVLHKSKELCV